MIDFEKKYQLAKSRAERLKKSAKVSEDLLEQRSRDLYQANQKLELAQDHLQLEIKQATYELNVANQRLRKSLKDKSHLIGAISHEIRTPLNAIMGYSELVESELEDGQVKERVQVISKSAESMMSLLNDILELTQIEVGNIKIEPTLVDLKGNLEFIDRSFQLQMKEKGLTWTISSENLPETVRFDVRRYNQIINNLISNALKYTLEGDVHLNCWCESNPLNPKQGLLRTKVTDSGVGISPDDQKIMFDLNKQIFKPSPIIKADSERKQQDDIALHSLGLGLPLCQILCQLLLGKITCQSALGQGSQFTVTLPVMLVNESEKGSQGNFLIHQNKKNTDSEKLQILIAEDTLVNQQLIKAQLAQLNQSADIVDNGLMALNKLEHQSYDLVILDILMPIMDGETTIKKIRSSEKRIAEHYCVALTAASYKEKGKHLLNMGFNEFLSKPITLFSLNELIDRISSGENLSIFSEREDTSTRLPETSPKITNDLGFFKEQFGEDAEVVFLKIAPTFVEQVQQNITKLEDALTSKELSTLNFIAHTMKGESQTFGYDQLAEFCKQLEKVESIERAGEIAEQIYQEVENVVNKIKDQLELLG